MNEPASYQPPYTITPEILNQAAAHTGLRDAFRDRQLSGPRRGFPGKQRERSSNFFSVINPLVQPGSSLSLFDSHTIWFLFRYCAVAGAFRARKKENA